MYDSVSGMHPKATWRFTLFSFVPEVFVDVWTPFVMGGIAMLAHFETWEKPLKWQTRSFINMGLYHCVTALFGCMGYAGGVGAVFCCFSWMVVFLGIVMYIWEDDDACLRLNWKFQAQARDSKQTIHV
eukprot:GHVO01010999.1.p1 GENE.GHVO01010999.1~~GHVO01010999.1.p1  ORF type:complete len:128 (+),score=9.28 GHVO01010999.1:175-558(+)